MLYSDLGVFMELTTLDMIYSAREVLKGVIDETPVLSSQKISNNVFFKTENLQKTGSFKIRGAYNKISTLTDEEASRGIIACSAGNHAQGVALSASQYGIKAYICMPYNAPKMKIEATRNYGGEVILVPGSYDDAAAKAVQLADEKGYTLIHPFNDPYVIAGQGTIGLEILEQCPDVEQVLVPIGGGGLISGVALAVKSLKPSCKVIGIQTQLVPSMFSSFAENEILTVKDNPTIADGIHVRTPGMLTFEMTNKYVDDIMFVSEDEIAGAMTRLLEWPKIVAEGAGATSAAAFIFGKVDTSLKTVCLISGGNVDIAKLHEVIEQGAVALASRKHL